MSNAGTVAVTGVDVSDSIPGAAISCGGGGSTALTVPADGSVQCSYAFAPGSQVPNNTATATWGDKSASDLATIAWAGRPTGVPASVVEDGEIDETIDLEDLDGERVDGDLRRGVDVRGRTPSPNPGRTNTAT